jgi:asparagine synthase (glutamine-hydrolysing)
VCGIYGILELDGSAAAAESLRPMGRLTVHRGPDDEGSYVNGPLAMGMRRLSIIDVAGGHQPLSNEDQTLWLVANGEIYNYRELRATLEAQGHRFQTGSDCETILHLYAQHGDEFLGHLNGMFAFALWDVRRRRLLVGRDRLGIKPLYLWNDGRRLVFASEAKAILALPGVGAELDRGALASYLGMGYVPAPQSIFRGVRKLPPATLLAAEGGMVAQRCYWRMPSDVDVQPVRGGVGGEGARKDRGVGADADGQRRADRRVPVRRHRFERRRRLHGRRTAIGPVKTYAIGFGGGTAETYYNELPYARQVAQLFGTDHHEIVVRPDVVSLLPSLLWHMDEPVADTAFITTYLVSQFARRDVTVILSGVGGDELFGGYRRYLGGHYQAQFNRLPRGLRRAASALGERLPSDRHSPLLNALRFAKGFLSTAGLPLEERYRSYVEVFADDVVAELLHAPCGSDDDPIAAAFRSAPGADELNRMLAVDAQTQLPDDLLLLTDKMSMAVSLECRVPLLDHELVELAARIPEQIKIRNGRLKHVLKRALQPTLPANILHRKKRGFGTPMGAWLKGDLAPLVNELLSAETVRARGLFRHAEIAKLIAAHAANRVDGTDRLLALLNLEIWSRIYLDQRTPADVADELKAATT